MIIRYYWYKVIIISFVFTKVCSWAKNLHNKFVLESIWYSIDLGGFSDYLTYRNGELQRKLAKIEYMFL